jgi:hypothetical protein
MNAARWHAPQEDGGTLIEPPPSNWPECVKTNAECFRTIETRFCGISLADWRSELRTLVAQLASVQLQRWGENVRWPEGGFLVTGHQPELFHPGVWAKCFALAEAAPKIGLVPLNLIADHDQPKPLAIRVPVRNERGLTTEWVPFCDASPALAWEEYAVSWGQEYSLPTLQAQLESSPPIPTQSAPNLCSEERFENFPKQVVRICGDLLPEMILPDFWSLAVELAARLNPPACLAETLSGARRLWEQRWGYHNAELRISALSDTEPFHAFVVTLLDQLPSFVQQHNAELYAFRRENRLRSRTHPVPPLRSAEGWCESPFWAWTRGQPRQPLWWSARNDGWQLRLGEAGPILHVRAVRRREDLSVWRQALQQAGWKIRPRALTLTLFVRLFLAELFVHGIGGAIYDRFTDRLLWRVWGIKPPHYTVVSATLRLPLPCPAAPPWNRAELLQRVRDCQFNPDRVLPPQALALPQVQSLVARKRALLQQWAEASREQRPVLHRQLAEIREALRPMTRQVEAELRQRLNMLAHYQAQSALVTARDWAFVLYSDSALTHLVEIVRQKFSVLRGV